jgi:hypothetical protein
MAKTVKKTIRSIARSVVPSKYHKTLRLNSTPSIGTASIGTPAKPLLRLVPRGYKAPVQYPLVPLAEVKITLLPQYRKITGILRIINDTMNGPRQDVPLTMREHVILQKQFRHIKRINPKLVSQVLDDIVSYWGESGYLRRVNSLKNKSWLTKLMLGTRRAFSKLKNFLTQKKRSPMARPNVPQRPIRLPPSPVVEYLKTVARKPISSSQLKAIQTLMTAANKRSSPESPAYRTPSETPRVQYVAPSSAEIAALYEPRTVKEKVNWFNILTGLAGHQFPQQTARKSLA